MNETNDKPRVSAYVKYRKVCYIGFAKEEEGTNMHYVVNVVVV